MRARARASLFCLSGLVAATLLPAACTPPVEPSEGCLSDAAGPPDELLYVSNEEDGTVSVVDPRECQTVATIDVDGQPGELNTLADGSLVTVVVRNADDDQNSHIAFIDTSTNKLAGTAEVGLRPTHTGVAPDGETLWVGNDDSASVTAIDLVAKEALGTVSVGNGHRKLIFDEAEPYRLYTSDIAAASVSVVDSASMALVATVPVGPGPHGLYYSRHSKQVYNCSGEPNGIDVIATAGDAALSVVEKIETSERCGYLTVSADGRTLWGTAGGADPETEAGVVYVIDTDTNDVVATVPVGKKPDKIEFLDELGLVIVGNVNDPSVSVIDAESYEVVRTIEVGGGEFHRAVKISRDGRHAYVPNAKDGTVSIFDVESGEVRGTVKVGGHPTGIIVAGPGGGLPYPH